MTLTMWLGGTWRFRAERQPSTRRPQSWDVDVTEGSMDSRVAWGSPHSSVRSGRGGGEELGAIPVFEQSPGWFDAWNLTDRVRRCQGHSRERVRALRETVRTSSEGTSPGKALVLP